MLKKKLIVVSLLLLGVVGTIFFDHEEVQAKAVTYTIAPTTAPINKAYLKYKGYNSSTKHYYLLDSYLKKIESNGGGTLVLKKGTYTVSNVLYIPSNTTLKLQNGAILKKGTSTGKASFAAAKTLIQVVPPKKSKLSKAVTKYNGSKNVKIIGTGTATIDLNNALKSPAITMAHAQNIEVSGIQFKRNNQATIIHVVASKKVNIKDNLFINAKTGTTLPAIRLESATNTSATYPLNWSKLDGTVNTTISMRLNVFDKQYAAIKTTAIVAGKYQSGIVIADNIFSSILNNAIYMTAWNKPSIYDNSFDDVASTAKETIVARATQYPTIKNNDFNKSKKILAFKDVVSSTIKNKISAANKKDLASNQGTGLATYSIALPLDDSVEFFSLDPEEESDEELIPEVEPEPTPEPNPVTDFVFDDETRPLKLGYEKYTTYVDMTKSYYVLRSILERLEAVGGGTLLIKKGDYTITNNLYVPSNVTIELEDGVVLRKALASGVEGLKASASLFQLVPPSKSTGVGTVGGFDGTKNVKIYSQGRATLDLQGVNPSFAIVMAHNENITIQNIDFVNLNGGHFIELDAAKNVLIDNSTFSNNLTTSTSRAHEAINLDTPDLLTKGFNSKWSNFDRSATENVTIQNSTFQNLVCSIGTHQMSGAAEIAGVTYTNMPHKNVKIINNTFINSRSEAIHAMNWEKPIIENNKFTNSGILNSKKNGIVSNGSFYPTIQNNTFESMGAPVKFATGKNATNAKEYAEIYNIFTEQNLKALATNTGENLTSYTIKLAGINQTNLSTKEVKIIKKY